MSTWKSYEDVVRHILHEQRETFGLERVEPKQDVPADTEAKDRAIAALRSDWYAQFDDAYAKWFGAQCEIGKGYQDETGQWMIRQDDDPTNDVPASIKVEYQRQCLFWRDGRDTSNPLRVTLRRLHPELCRLIEDWRQRMTPTELSDVLTRAEGSLVVDYAMSVLASLPCRFTMRWWCQYPRPTRHERSC